MHSASSAQTTHKTITRYHTHKNNAKRLTSDVVLTHIQVSLCVEGQAAGPNSAAELVEHACMEHSRGLLEKPQDAVRHHLRHKSVYRMVGAMSI